MQLLKPVNPTLVIHDPKTRERVPMEGIVVDERDAFWKRRVTEGSMTAGPVPAKAPKTMIIHAVE